MIVFYNKVSTHKIAMSIPEAVEQACLDSKGNLDLAKVVALLEQLIREIEPVLGRDGLIRVLGAGFESKKDD